MWKVNNKCCLLSLDRDHDGLVQDAGDRGPHLQGPGPRPHPLCQPFISCISPCEQI